MNKILKTAMAGAIAITSAQAATFWTLAEDGGSSGTGGYWYEYSDKDEKGSDGTGGCTSTNFPQGSNEEDIVSDAWRALDGGTGAVTYTWNTGCDYKYPFAGIGLNWTDPKAEAPDAAGSHSGICVYYSLSGEGNFSIELSTFADGPDGTPTGWNEYAVSLPKGDNLGSGRYFAWSAFNQDANWGKQIDRADALSKSDGLKFKGALTAADVTSTKTGKLRIIGIGWDACDGIQAIYSANAANAVKMNLAGKMLSLSGVSSNTAVKVINLHGALVAEGIISPTRNSINLSNLPSGVYMVKLSSGSQNFTQKVILK